MGHLLKDYFDIKEEKKAFLDDFRPKYILSSLVKDQALSDEEKNHILKKETNVSQIEELLEILKNKDSEVILSFLNALNEDDAYPWLAERMDEKLWNNRISSDVRCQLASSGIPFSPNHFVKPKKNLLNIRDALIEASEKCRWFVVLHGMIGCGKTVLAAESLQDNHIFETYYTGGAYWIPVGKLKGEHSLLRIMDTLYEKLEIDKHSYASNPDFMEFHCTVKRTTDHLKKHIHKKFGKSQILIILDDVWDDCFDGVSVLSAFDIGVPIMVTTQVKSIMDEYEDFCTFIDCGRGLSDGESRDLLARYVRCSQTELPEVVTDMCNKCKGSPLMLSRIGASQARYGVTDLGRWTALRDKLEGGVISLRVRHSSGDLKTMLKDVLRFCLEPLGEWGPFFSDLVVFLEDVTIPSKVLEVFWNKDEDTVEDIMLELSRKSLIMRERGPKRDPSRFENSFCYSIHDLYLEILKDVVENQQKVHEKLVESYLNMCKVGNTFDFGLLQKDDYIHHFIGYHLNEAKEYKTLKDIYLDLTFIQDKIHISGPGDLLWDYRLYESCFENDKEELKDFENFVRRNGSHIYENNCDVIQLALFEPSNSTVHKKAKEIASAKPNKYFEWCNQEDTRPYSNNLNVKSYEWDVKHSTFSPDGSAVASVGEKVVIWFCSSGEEFQTLSGHTDTVNCCAFNSAGNRLATASADKTVKIFDILLQIPRKSSKGKRGSLPSIITGDMFKKHDMSLFTFDRHDGEVLWCSYSPDDDYLISSDVLGAIYVWESESLSARVKHSICHNSLPVHICSFNHSGTEFATASGDEIKLWNSDTGRCQSTIKHNDMLVSQFSFTPDKQYVLSCYNNIISRWDSNGNQQPVFTSSGTFTFNSCCLSPDGNFFACGTSDRSVFVWIVSTWKLIANLKGHQYPVVQVMFSNDGTKLLSQSSDVHIIHNMQVMPDSSMICLKDILSVQHQEQLYIASSNYTNSIELRIGFKGDLKCKTPQDESDITVCSLSSDCTEIAYGTKSGSVKVFNINDKSLVSCIPGHMNEVTYLIHKKHDLTFFTCSDDKMIMVWKNQRLIKKFQGHTKTVVMCVPFKKCKRLLSCSADGTLRVWYIDSKDSPMIIEGHGNQRVAFCDVSSNELYLASASSDNNIKVWNSENGVQLKSFSCKDCVRCCRFAPNCSELVLGLDCGDVMLWKWNKEVPKTIGHHESWVNNIQYSSDALQFITVSNSVKLWDNAGHLSQTLSLPGANSCVIWAKTDFKVFVLIHNSILYILKKIE